MPSPTTTKRLLTIFTCVAFLVIINQFLSSRHISQDPLKHTPSPRLVLYEEEETPVPAATEKGDQEVDEARVEIDKLEKKRNVNSMLELLEDCSQAKTCLQCLHATDKASAESYFDRPYIRSSVGSAESLAALGRDQKVAPVGISSCIWCASKAKCMPAMSTKNPSSYTSVADYKGQSSDDDVCDDVEDASCPAALQGKDSQVPQNFRVIHVAIKKGGPEALVQMHLALNHWGFKTTLDARKGKQSGGGDVVPFFKKVYSDEFSSAPAVRWSKNYDDWWQNTGAEGDVLIATETWKCPSNGIEQLGKGIRYMQWHLTTWKRNDRSSCTISTHTHYIAVDYMRQSARSLMFPYIGPNIVEKALSKSSQEWQKMKTNLVMYDHDAKLKDSDLTPVTAGVKHETKLASGYTPENLYALYGKMKAAIDLALPGGERFIYEAALFDSCLVIDRSSNGGDTRDFPIPDEFRVEPNSLPALNKAKDLCISKYASVIPEFLAIKTQVYQQRSTFYRQVRRYYSNSVHVVTRVNSKVALMGSLSASVSNDANDDDGGRPDEQKRVGYFIAGVITQFPLATIEVQVPTSILSGIDGLISKGSLKDGYIFTKEFLSKITTLVPEWKSLLSNSYLPSVTFVATSQAPWAGLPKKIYATSIKQSLYTMVLPDVGTFLFPREDTIHLLGNLLTVNGEQKSGIHSKDYPFIEVENLLWFGRTSTVMATGGGPAGGEGRDGNLLEEFSNGFASYHSAIMPLALTSAKEPSAGEVSRNALDFVCEHIVPQEVMKHFCDGGRR